ncbi:MAG: DUF502 domain-containing protein [Candidatus Methylomirabilales bacterium]
MDGLRSNFRGIFITGLLISIPILITLLTLWWFFSLVDGILAPILDRAFGIRIPGLGFLSALLLIFCVGLFARNVAGQRLLTWAEDLFLRVPIAKSLYPAVKRLTQAFSPGSGGSFKRVVMVQYPRSGIYAFGFLTDSSTVELSPEEPQVMVAVYIPTNHLYLGEVVLFREGDVLYPDLTLDEGIQVILSGGMALPTHIRQRPPLRRVEPRRAAEGRPPGSL